MESVRETAKGGGRERKREEREGGRKGREGGKGGREEERGVERRRKKVKETIACKTRHLRASLQLAVF